MKRIVTFAASHLSVLRNPYRQIYTAIMLLLILISFAGSTNAQSKDDPLDLDFFQSPSVTGIWDFTLKVNASVGRDGFIRRVSDSKDWVVRIRQEGEKITGEIIGARSARGGACANAEIKGSIRETKVRFIIIWRGSCCPNEQSNFAGEISADGNTLTGSIKPADVPRDYSCRLSYGDIRAIKRDSGTDPVAAVASSNQDQPSQQSILTEADVAAQSDKAFCSIANAMGKGCDDTLDRVELWKGWITYLKSAGYSVVVKGEDVVAFGSIEQLHAIFGDGVGHIEVTHRRNIYAPQTPTPTSRALGAGAVTHDSRGVRRTTPADITPLVAVRWWVFNDLNKPGSVKKIVADNIDLPYYPLEGYAAELALAIDPNKAGTNRTKFAAYFNNKR